MHGRTSSEGSLYHDAKESGWDRTKNLPAHPPQAEDLLGETFDTAEGASECLSCHTTTVRSVREGSGPESLDKGIGCERCHGPGELHLAAIRTKFPDPVIASPAHAAPSAIKQLCGKCHAQHFLAMPASRSDPAWARFPSSNLPWSRCYSESGGALHCVTCHDPHRDAETSSAHYEAKCLSCHATSSTTVAPPRTDQGTQAFRSPCPVNPTRNCLQCHMPKMPYRQLHTLFTDHYIRVPATGTQARR
jgi:Cytochrome c554 and c-prime